MFKQIEINGFRGFSTNQMLKLAEPNETPGSGLTVIVGPNNAGKSTIIESLRSFAFSGNPSFSYERRNLVAGDSVNMKLKQADGTEYEIQSIEPGSSETQRTPELYPEALFILPSRRVFAPYFSKSESDRNTYTQQIGNQALRANTIDAFVYRLFKVAKTPESKMSFPRNFVCQEAGYNPA